MSGKNNTELREMCAAAGITGISKKNKKQLIKMLQDVGSAGSTGLKTNLPSAEIASATQRLDAAVKQAAQKKHDKTVVEQVKVKKQPFRKRLKRALNILLVTILVISGLTAWTIYQQDLTFQELKQIAQKIEENPASAFDRFITIAKEKSKVIAVSAYDQLIAFAKEKYKDISASSSEPKSTAPVTSQSPIKGVVKGVESKAPVKAGKE